MAFDSALGEAVLFGGLGESGNPLGDTWKLDSLHWYKQKSSDHPSPRFGHAMSFDSTARVVLLFGGETAGKTSGETWLFRQGKWSLFRGEGTPPRAGAQLAYDSHRQHIVLFGGVDFNRHVVFDDTWEWNGQRWLRAASAGPPGRFYGAMAYDARRQQVILYGGNRATDVSGPEKWSAGRLGDTWSWTGRKWRAIDDRGPSHRDHHAMAYDPTAKAVILFGGFDGHYLDDTWKFADAWQRLPLSRAPPPRGGRPALFLDDIRQQLLMFGGGTGAGTNLASRPYNDLWSFSSSGWEAEGSCP